MKINDLNVSRVRAYKIYLISEIRKLDTTHMCVARLKCRLNPMCSTLVNDSLVFDFVRCTLSGFAKRLFQIFSDTVFIGTKAGELFFTDIAESG